MPKSGDGWTVPKTREGIVKALVEMEKARQTWESENKAKKAEPKAKKTEKAVKAPKGEPGEASKTLKKVSALKGAKKNAYEDV